MAKALVVSAIVSMMLLVAVPVFAASQVAVDITLATGAGTLQDSTRFGVAVLSLQSTGPRKSLAVNRGWLVVDGIRTKCSVEAEIDCSAATLTCDDLSTHVVVPAESGGSKGSLDGVEVTQGFVHLKCSSR